METSITYSTEAAADEPLTLEPERTYYHLGDAEIFTVVSLSEETATVCYHRDGTVELVDRSEVEPEKGVITPCKTVPN